MALAFGLYALKEVDILASLLHQYYGISILYAIFLHDKLSVNSTDFQYKNESATYNVKVKCETYSRGLPPWLTSTMNN